MISYFLVARRRSIIVRAISVRVHVSLGDARRSYVKGSIDLPQEPPEIATLTILWRDIIRFLRREYRPIDGRLGCPLVLYGEKCPLKPDVFLDP